jgi:hypothetical protein
MKEEDTCEDSEFNSTGRGLVGIINVAFVGFLWAPLNWAQLIIKSEGEKFHAQELK